MQKQCVLQPLGILRDLLSPVLNLRISFINTLYFYHFSLPLPLSNSCAPPVVHGLFLYSYCYFLYVNVHTCGRTDRQTDTHTLFLVLPLCMCVFRTNHWGLGPQLWRTVGLSAAADCWSSSCRGGAVRHFPSSVQSCQLMCSLWVLRGQPCSSVVNFLKLWWNIWLYVRCFHYILPCFWKTHKVLSGECSVFIRK